MGKSRRPLRSVRRRGSIYLYVTIMATLVSLIGLSALMMVRIRRETITRTADAIEARSYAQAAIRMGMQYIKDDPDWRYTYSHGAWKTDVPVGNGTFTLLGHDTSDSDLSDAPEDPVRLIGIGKRGDSVHKMRVDLVPVNRGFDCLKVAMHANNDLKPKSGSTIDCDHWISANNKVDADAATVNSDVQAVNDVTGGSYNGATEIGIAPRSVPPVPGDVIAWYVANGTTIPRTALDVGYPNLLKNNDFENGTAHWTGSTASTLSNETLFPYNGAASLKVSSRTAWHQGPTHDLMGLVQNGATYEVQAWIKMDSIVDVGVDFRIKVNGTGFATSTTDIKLTDGWVLVSKTITPSWTGALTDAELRVRTVNGDAVTDFYVDDIQLKKQGSDYTIHSKILSPSSNPYGTPDPNGVYVIDLEDDKVFIENTRVYGTLVLIKPHSTSEIGGGAPIHLSPAVPGFPALLVTEKEVTINPSDTGLSEDALQVNFNPAGAPFNNVTDTDQSDTYPSEIRGLVYSEKKINFQNQNTIHGVVISNENIEVEGTLNSTYDSSFYLNPPPGFSGPEEIRILLNSAARPLN